MKGLLFTYVVTFGGAAWALVNPFVGVLVYVAFAILKPQFLWGYAGATGDYSLLVGIAALVGWAGKGFGNWQLGRAWPIVLCFLAYVAWASLSAAFAPNSEVAWAFVADLAKILGCFIIGITLATSVDQLRRLAWALVLTQGYVAFEMNLSYYLDGVNRAQEDGFGGMDNNSFAISLVATLGPAIFLGIYSQKRWQKLLAFAAAAAIMHTILLTFSRGGMLGLIASAVVALFVIPRQPKYFAVLAIAILLGLRLSGPQIVERFTTTFADEADRDVSAQNRVELWRACLVIISQNPIVGIGPAHLPLLASSFGWSEGKEAHSLWLQLGAELGVAGVGFLLLFYLFCMKRLWRLARSKVGGDDPWFSAAGCMVVTGLAGFMVSAQFVTLWGLETPFYIVLLGASTLKVWSAQEVKEPAATQQPSHVLTWESLRSGEALPVQTMTPHHQAPMSRGGADPPFVPAGPGRRS